MTGFSLRLTRLRTPSASSTQRPPTHLARRRAGRDHRRHERRPHAELGRPRDGRDAGERRPGGPRQPRRGGFAGSFWERLDQIPDDELWETHIRQKLELAVFARRRLRSQFARHGESPAVLDALESALEPRS